MSLLVRKIDFGKWTQNAVEKGAPVSADAITNCTRTRGNKLSLWRISDENALEEAVLALTAAPLVKDFDTIHVVLLEEVDLTQSGLKVEVSHGDTAVADLVDTHRDIVGLTYPLLGPYSQLIVREIKEKNVKMFRRSQLREIVGRAIENKRVSRESLNPELQKKIDTVAPPK